MRDPTLTALRETGSKEKLELMGKVDFTYGSKNAWNLHRKFGAHPVSKRHVYPWK